MLVFAAVAALVIGIPAVGSSYPRPGLTERASVSTGGAEADDEPDYPSISADGRFVVFESDATNLVPGDTNESTDVFLRDLAAGTMELVSVGRGGGAANGASRSGSVSADGRYVAFESDATDLVPGDTNESTDIFVRDREAGTTILVSGGMGGAPAEAGPDQCLGRFRLSFRPSISADGSRVAFASWAANLVPGDTNGCADIFVRDLTAGTTDRVSVSTEGAEANNNSVEPAISGDGTVVVFGSPATNLVAAGVVESGGVIHVYARDLKTGTTDRASVSSDGDPANGWASSPTVTHDGSEVVFWSFATNLVPHDANTKIDVFVHDRETGRTERVSTGSDGREGNENAGWETPAVSADGRYVAFSSDASNLVEDDQNVRLDVFVRDRLTGETQRISLSDAGEEGDGSSWEPALSADGRKVVFLSNATNLVPGDTNAETDVFVRDRGPEVGVLDLRAEPQADVVSVSGRAVVSGRRITSASDPAGDGVGELGADLIAASVAVRPESEDLLVRLDLTGMPVVRPDGNSDLTVAGAPGVVYGLAFEAGGVEYEVRAGRTSAAEMFSLWRCEDECTEIAELGGGIGTVDAAVVVAVPLSLFPESPLSGLQAFVDLGDVTKRLGREQDTVGLPDAELLAPIVEVGVASAGTPEGEVAFEPVGDFADGAFSGSVDSSSLAGGDYRVWARACLGEVCGTASMSVDAG